MEAHKVVRYRLVRRKEVSRIYHKKKARRAQIVSLPVLEGNQKPGPRGIEIKEMGAKSKNMTERLVVTERNHDASFE